MILENKIFIIIIIQVSRVDYRSSTLPFSNHIYISITLQINTYKIIKLILINVILTFSIILWMHDDFVGVNVPISPFIYIQKLAKKTFNFVKDGRLQQAILVNNNRIVITRFCIFKPTIYI